METEQRLTPDELSRWAIFGDPGELHRRVMNAIKDAIYQEKKSCVDAHELRNAIAKFLNATGHDLCHENRAELAAAAGLNPGTPGLPEEQEFAEECIRYRQSLYGHSGPGSDADVYEARIRLLQAELDQARSKLADAESGGCK